MAVRHLVTAEELERMGEPEQGWDYELVRGELVPVMAAGRQHGVLTGSLTFELTSFVRQHGLGRVYTDGLGYKLSSNPDTVRVPDVSFVSREREPAVRGGRGFRPGAPALTGRGGWGRRGSRRCGVCEAAGGTGGAAWRTRGLGGRGSASGAHPAAGKAVRGAGLSPRARRWTPRDGLPHPPRHPPRRRVLHQRLPVPGAQDRRRPGDLRRQARMPEENNQRRAGHVAP